MMRILVATVVLVSGLAAGAADTPTGAQQAYAEMVARQKETKAKDPARIAEFEAFLARHGSSPQAVDARFELSELLQSNGRGPEAVKMCDEALALSPPQALKEKLLVSRAEAYSWMEKPGRAAAEPEAALSQIQDAKRRVNARFEIAEFHGQAKDHEKARAAYDALAEESLTDGQQARLLNGQAKTYFALGKGAEFAADVERRLASQKDPARARSLRLALARLYMSTDRTEKARALLDALASDPSRRTVKTVRRLQEELDQLGRPPAGFSVKDTRGEEFSLARYKGKVVLLDFWASWCGPCVAEMPNVKATYDALKGKGFVVLGVSLDEDRKAMDAYVAENKIPWPQFTDDKGWNNELADLYGVEGIPYTMLLDRQGNVRRVNVRGEELRPAVEKLL